MKKLLFIFSFFIFNISLSLGQSFTCGNGSFSVTSVACTASVLTFSVTNSNPDACTSVLNLSIPADVTVNGNPIANTTSFFLPGGSYSISIATPNCAPVALLLNYSGGACDGCPPGTFVLTGPSAPIPTMGEWSLIILALMLSIGGIVVYKSRSAISKLVSLRSIHK